MADEGQIRWELADDSQERLFGLTEREVGKGEFRGMEFLHVRAKSIINEVPASSRVPFRYTVNVYRGCSHACVYCAVGDTPVLMADGRPRPLAEVRPGDLVYGTRRVGSYRRYVVTEVLDHWKTLRPAFRVTLEDGTSLVTSGDHRFLTDRGWKHVTGSEQGADRRPHLTVNNELMGTGGFAEGPKQGTDYRRGYLCGLVSGGREPDMGRDLPEGAEALQRADGYLAEMGIPVPDIQAVIEWPRRPSTEWRKGFLAGIFDAEGSYSRGILRISNTDQAIVDRIEMSLRAFGFSFMVERRARSKLLLVVRLRGGLREHLRFFHTVDPAITRKRDIEGTAIKSDAPLRVESIEPLGIELPMYDITTGTGDFIADGVVSHNCFARPTHEYLGLGAGEDFERKIVVKVNAVELLRAETEPGRWAGEHIAMGTNTDPYQRCEGKYRLTRGVVEVLTERANPFSILTKNTLVLRDLELLAEAVRRTDVAVNLSIGTLDEDVWRATEPNTPHPMRRMEAVARLNEAGIPCGVLIAPVLPGLSDAPEQLEAVAEAAVEAGAPNVYPIVLHLRPGVKEQFMPWLGRDRPDLVPLYRRLYPRSYAPRKVQDEVAGRVRVAIRRRGGPASRPNSRGVASEEPDQAPEPRQLELGV